MLFVKTCNNYRFNLKRNRLVKYINQIQGFVNEATGRKLRGAEYKNGYKWIMAKMRDRIDERKVQSEETGTTQRDDEFT